jgi:hypothetical protein
MWKILSRLCMVLFMQLEALHYILHAVLVRDLVYVIGKVDEVNTKRDVVSPRYVLEHLYCQIQWLTI